MTNRLPVGAVLLAALPVLAHAAPQTAQPTATDLWRTSPSATVLDASTLDSTVRRWREVDLVAPEALALTPSQRVRLELFDGEVVELTLERAARPRPGSVSFLGGEPGGEHLALALVDDAAAATLWVGERLYALQHAPSGELLLVERTLEAPGTCGVGPEQHIVAPTGQRAGASAESEGDAGGEGGSGSGSGAGAAAAASELVDVVTAYTPAARQAAGGTTKILALIDLAVLETNLSYDNGQAGIELRLVYADEVDYDETGSLSTDLSRLRSKTDGYMDEVHPWRDAYGGDAVALITNTADACGKAYLMVGVSNNFKNSAFSVTKRSCATGYYTYGHELGHNFGCAHDTDNAGSASKPYAYGYRTPNALYRSVMSYSPGSRKPIFSGPNGSWNGYVMGVEGSEDNSKALTLNAPTIASWRAAVVGTADCDGDGTPDIVEIADGSSTDVDANGIPDDCQSLSGASTTVSLLFGGSQPLTLDAGPEHAGRIYVLLGSLAGTDLPTDVGGVAVPLTQDSYFDLTLAQPATGLMLGAFGLLDGQGKAGATFTIPPGIPLFELALTPANHAFVVLDETLAPAFASNPVPVSFTVF